MIMKLAILTRKLLKSSFLLGVASIFCPSVINIDYLKPLDKSDAQNLNEDWGRIGEYMTNAYGKLGK